MVGGERGWEGIGGEGIGGVGAGSKFSCVMGVVVMG